MIGMVHVIVASMHNFKGDILKLLLVLLDICGKVQASLCYGVLGRFSDMMEGG